MDDGCHFVYTVNAAWLPSPPLQSSELQLRRDCQFGCDDPVLWPQPFAATLPHYAVIRNPPSDLTDASSVWWWLSESQHIVFLSLNRLGLLHADLTCSFLSSIQALCRRVDAYRDWQSRAGHEPKPALSVYIVSVENNYQQLLVLEASLHQICLCLVEMQNTYHFAVAALDWLEICVPRYNGQTLSVSTVADVVGTFVYDIKQGSCLAQCGVSVWIIRGFADVRHICIDELLPISDPSHMLETTPAPGASVIYCGLSGVKSLQCMAKYYARSLAGTNPFIPSTPLLSLSSTRPSSILRPLPSASSRDLHCSNLVSYLIYSFRKLIYSKML